MQSSYQQHNYAGTFTSLVTAYKPVTCVELGVLDGYSTIAIAKGLLRNKESIGLKGHLDAYDLFDKYPYKHGSKGMVEVELFNYGLDEFVSIYEADAFEVHNKYNDNSVSFLHVDLSNTGYIVRRIIDRWDKKIVVGGAVVIEGGTEERDNIEWMKKYNKEPIKPEIESNPIINDKYVYGTYLLFPGLTVLYKKHD